MVKNKNRYKITLLLVVLSLAWLAPLPLMGRGFIPPKTSAPSFSWQDTTFSTTFVRIWDGQSIVVNYSNSYEETYKTNGHVVNETENTWTRNINTIRYKANYSYFSNITISGNITIDIDIDIYRVNLQYKDLLNMYWFALKNGTTDAKYYLDQSTHQFNLNESYNQGVVTEYTKFNMSNWEVLDEWIEITNTTGVTETIQASDPWNHTEYTRSTRKFCKPVILVSQLFTTENKDKFAWAEMVTDLLIYKDKNFNGIFDAGVREGSTDWPNLFGSDESYGSIIPKAEEYDFYYEETHPNEPWQDMNITVHMDFPNDKTVEEIASNIVFTPPTLDENDILSWEIVYPQQPIWASVFGADVDNFNTGNTYASMSPTDFSYKYDYNVSNSEANLDFTFGMSKISDPDLYDVAQGMGLSITHYNFFISSFDVFEKNPKEFTVPSSLFTFESNGTTVAEVNLVDPKKVNYTLFDYPKTGIDSQLESYGGSLHKAILETNALNSYLADPLLNLMYTLEDTVDADSDFIKVDSLQHLETQNYPVWNGEKLLHDPTFTIYYDPQEDDPEPPVVPDPTSIPGFSTALVVAVSSVVVAIKVAKRKKKIEQT